MASRKKDLGAQLLRLLSLLGDVSITSSNFTNNSEVITLHLPSSERRCPICGSNNCIIRGSGRWQEYKHFPVNNRSIHLRIFKPRMYCQDCRSSFYQTPDWVIPRLRMTKYLFQVIYRNFTEMNDFSKISNNLMIGETTIRSVFDSIDIKHPSNLPKTLCIDEFHADSGFL